MTTGSRSLVFLLVSVFSPLLCADDLPQNVNERDARGRTHLLRAVYDNDIARAQMLIAAGADLNLKDDLQDTAFLYAGAEGRSEILKLLIAAKPDTAALNRYGGTALIPAAHHGFVENVRLLLTLTDIDVNHVNNLGWTALLEAVILGDGGPSYQQIVKLLLDHGANAALADRDGVTPLEHAQRRGFAGITALFTNEEPFLHHKAF